MSRRLNVKMVYQTVQIMDIQKTKAKRKTLPCIFSTKEHPECCRFFPLSFPLLEGEDLPFWQHIIQTLALIEFVSCYWDSTIYEPSTPRSCFILATPSLPNFMPLGFHSTINLLLSMGVRSWWGNPPLPWADHFFSAVSPWWAWQSYHACTLKWSWCSPNGTGVGGGDEDLSLASVGVLDWALQGWRHSAFFPC